MKKPEKIKEKIRQGHVLNLSELAFATGYPRGVLGKLNLPLIASKISLSDFRRIIQARQDTIEQQKKEVAHPQTRRAVAINGQAQGAGEDCAMSQLADRFYSGRQ